MLLAHVEELLLGHQLRIEVSENSLYWHGRASIHSALVAPTTLLFRTSHTLTITLRTKHWAHIIYNEMSLGK